MVRLGFRGGFGLSALLLAGLVWALIWSSRDRPSADRQPRETLVLYCAAGLRPPIEEIRAAYEASWPVALQTKYAGSGVLLSDLRVAGGDLFLAAEREYLDDARKDGLVREIVPVAQQSPVIVVRNGNPKNITGLESLLRPDVQLSLADPKRAAIGRMVERLLKAHDGWSVLWKKAAIQRETVNLVANDVKLRAADAGIVWDATAVQDSDLAIVHVPLFDRSKSQIAIGVLTASPRPRRAEEFVRYLTAPKHGQRIFQKYGYDVGRGESRAAADGPVQPEQ